MDSSANNSRHNAMSSEYDRTASASTSTTSPAITETATTISTIVLQSHPIQIVVGLLQVKIKNASSFGAFLFLICFFLSLSLCHPFISLFICFRIKPIKYHLIINYRLLTIYMLIPSTFLCAFLLVCLFLCAIRSVRTVLQIRLNACSKLSLADCVLTFSKRRFLVSSNCK